MGHRSKNRKNQVMKGFPGFPHASPECRAALGVPFLSLFTIFLENLIFLDDSLGSLGDQPWGRFFEILK
jgi:hypothetical protein